MNSERLTSIKLNRDVYTGLWHITALRPIWNGHNVIELSSEGYDSKVEAQLELLKIKMENHREQ